MKVLNLILLTALAFPLRSSAATGTSGAEPFSFLLLDANARPSALGGAYTALASDVNALYYNPAGLGVLSGDQATFMHNQYFQDITQEYAAYKSMRGFGVYVNRLAYGDMKNTTISNPTGAGLGKVSASDLAASVGYGHALSETISAGLGAKLISGALANERGNSFAFDFGLLYAPPAGHGLSMGLAVQNIGPAVQFQSDKERLPFVLRAGTGYTGSILNQTGRLSLDFIKERSDKADVAVGGELVIAESFPVRVGYNTRNDDGFGITLGMGYVFKGFSIDYAFAPFKTLGAAHRFSVTMLWGNPSETDRHRLIYKKMASAGENRQQLDPAVTAEYEGAAAALEGKQDGDKTSVEYKKALAVKFSDPETHIEAGNAFMASGNARSAADSYSEAFQLIPEGDPREVFLSERLGAALLQQGDIKEAKGFFKQGIAIAKEGNIANEHLVRAYYGLALCLEKEGQTANAIANYKKALKLSTGAGLQKNIRKRLDRLKTSSR